MSLVERFETSREKVTGGREVVLLEVKLSEFEP
jgi:hypothetical protein